MSVPTNLATYYSRAFGPYNYITYREYLTRRTSESDLQLRSPAIRAYWLDRSLKPGEASTLYGFTSIHKKNVLAHKIWMIRSYAMAMTAVTFRVYHIMFFLLDWDHLENYEISLWISVIGNMLFAEWVIYRKSRNYLKSFAV